MNMEMKKYFTIHCMNAINNKSFSIVRANIENTPEKLSLAKEIFSEKDYHFQFHTDKINISPVVGNN